MNVFGEGVYNIKRQGGLKTNCCPSTIFSIAGKKAGTMMAEDVARHVEETYGRKNILRIGEELKVKIPSSFSKYFDTIVTRRGLEIIHPFFLNI